jgi:hypothetical protein
MKTFVTERSAPRSRRLTATALAFVAIAMMADCFRPGALDNFIGQVIGSISPRASTAQ